MITIKDIAEMASVSRSTVSRVLNNSGYVSEEARARVEKVIKETGYTPSVNATSLRTKKTKVIGVILPTIKTETPSRVVTGLGTELSKEGYEILLANTNQDKRKEIEYLDLLKMRQVDGIVLLPTNTEPDLLEKIREIDIPLVMVGQESQDVHSVIYDDYQAARELTAFLIGKGHEKIAFIGVDETDKSVGHSRKQGYLDEMEATGLAVDSAWVKKGVFDIDSGYASMKEILANAADRPTAVFAVTDRLAIGAMSLLKEEGLKVPEDMAVAGIGASELSRYVDPPLTTIDYENEKAGEEAARQIISCIRSDGAPEKVILGYRLIVRKSV